MEHASSRLSLRLSRSDLGVLALAAVFGAALYLGVSLGTYRIGFPLDDSWIHLTYARNLAEQGEWAFQPGHLSAGSTAPLWTLLLAVGFWLRLGPYAWTYFVGELCLFALAVLAEHAVRQLSPTYRPRWPWVGLFFVAEWHLQWAALSGMETLLQGLLVTTVLVLLMSGTRRYLLFGILTGLSVWVRPDGLTLAGPVLLVILLCEPTLHAKGSAVARYAIGFGALFLPYLAFNLWLSDAPMPNTFYAKQAEYAAWQARPILYRLGMMLLQLLAGPALLLIPGVVWKAWSAARRRSWRVLAAMAWCAGYLLLYVLRLPVYQHARYLMPAMPVLFLFGWLAYADLWHASIFGERQYVVQGAAQLALLLLTAGFVALGARSYGQDVGLIESEMVVTAKWVQANLPPEAVIAAHDIGALGYFDHHELIDLAGLVSPEVIPFIRDEGQLAAFMDRRHASYLVAFPAFYPQLTRSARPVFTSGGAFAPTIGQKNMAVYRWQGP